MNRPPITHRHLGPNVVGRPSERPDPQATGLNANARRELDKYGNPEVKRRVIDVLDRKHNAPQSTTNNWPPAETSINR